MSWHFLSYCSIASVVDALIARLSEACERITSVGELPGKSPTITEIRLLAISRGDRLSDRLQLLQKRKTVNFLREGHYRFHYMGYAYPFKLMISTEEAWVASLFQASAGRDLYITIATAAKNMGMKWVPARGGFEVLKTGEMRIAGSEEEVFEIARLPYVPPEKRNQWVVFGMSESGMPPILTKEQMRAWAASVSWTDTNCGGELHQYTFRKAGDEQAFVHVAESIRELGHDGTYLRKKWRYLDLAPYFYFTCGTAMETTSLINRKKLQQPETPWARNPVPWIPFTQPNQNARDLRTSKTNQQLNLWDFAAGSII